MKKTLMLLFFINYSMIIFSQISMEIEEDTIYALVPTKKLDNFFLVPITLKISLTDTNKNYVLYNVRNFVSLAEPDGDGLFNVDSTYYYQYIPASFPTNSSIKSVNFCLIGNKLQYCKFDYNFENQKVILTKERPFVFRTIFLIIDIPPAKMLFSEPNQHKTQLPIIMNYNLLYQQSKIGSYLYFHKDSIDRKKIQLFLGDIYTDTISVVLISKSFIRKNKIKNYTKAIKLEKSDVGFISMNKK